MATSPNQAQVYFGGPDRPARLLRHLLEQRIEAVPAGGEIDWVTYYFRDRGLAHARPRLPHANAGVAGRLAGPEGIGGGFKALTPPRLVPGLAPRSRVHANIYCFSHPRPAALIGSFNPAGDDLEDPQVVAEIGDQDRRHNLLVELADNALVSALVRHARRIHGRAERPLWRCRAGAIRVVAHQDTRLCFYPRLDHRLMLRQLARLGQGHRLRIASSHIKARSTLNALCRACRRGADIRLITHDTERRAPDRALHRLRDAGADIRRYRDDGGLPMHNKFMLLESGHVRQTFFGSLNLNLQSQLLNHEVLAISTDPQLFTAFDERWTQIESQIHMN